METVESYAIRSVDRSEVLRYLGYAGQTLSDELDARIDAGMARCLEVGRPRGCVRVFEVAGHEVVGGVPVLRLVGCALELRGRSIAAHLDGAVAVGVLAVTVGLGVDAELRRLSLTDPVAQVVVDAAGSALVERAADAAEARVVAIADKTGEEKLFMNSNGELPLHLEHLLQLRHEAAKTILSYVCGPRGLRAVSKTAKRMPEKDNKEGKTAKDSAQVEAKAG